MTTATTKPPAGREAGPSWALVTRITTAVNAGLVVALLLLTSLHVLDLRVGVVADVGLILLSLAVSLLVSRLARGPVS